MAVTQNTLIGKTRGSVGGTTFTKWKGLNVLKGKAQNNYTNPTTTQVNNNSKFAIMQAFMKSIATFIVAGFKAMAVNMTEYNAFSQANKYSDVITGGPGTYKVDPNVISISKGPELQGNLINTTVEAAGANDVLVVYGPDISLPQDAPVYAAAFESATGELVASSLGVSIISDNELTLTAPALGTNWEDHTFLIFYVNPATGKACDSVKATTI